MASAKRETPEKTRLKTAEETARVQKAGGARASRSVKDFSGVVGDWVGVVTSGACGSPSTVRPMDSGERRTRRRARGARRRRSVQPMPAQTLFQPYWTTHHWSVGMAAMKPTARTAE